MRRPIHIDARNEHNLSRHVRDSRRSMVAEIVDSLKEGSVISDGHVSVENEPMTRRRSPGSIDLSFS